MLKKLSAKVDAKVASYYFGLITGMLGPVEEMFQGIHMKFDLDELMGLFLIGFLSFVGMNLLNRSLKFGDAGKITLMTYA